MENYSCSKCKKKFNKYSFYNKHIKDKVCERKYICIKCNKEFRDNSDLDRHMKKKIPCAPDISEPIKEIENKKEEKETTAEKMKKLEETWKNNAKKKINELIDLNENNIIIDNFENILIRISKIVEKTAEDMKVLNDFKPPIAPPLPVIKKNKLLFPKDENKMYIFSILMRHYDGNPFIKVKKNVVENNIKQEAFETKKISDLIEFIEIDDQIEVKLKGIKITQDEIENIYFKYNDFIYVKENEIKNGESFWKN